MVAAIDFAVRAGAGGTVHGHVAGDAVPNLIHVAPGDSVSLNISQASVTAFQRVDGDLLIALADGRTIILEGYFNTPEGVTNHLYFSENGQIIPVTLDGGQDGLLVANYGHPIVAEKWSMVDDLRFGSSDPVVVGAAANEPAGMAVFAPAVLGAGGGASAAGLGAAAIGGGVLVAGAGTLANTSNGGGTHTAPTINAAGALITTNSADKTATVAGTGQAGDTVTVVLGGKTQTVTIANDGTWSAHFTTLPADGTYTASAVVHQSNGDTVNLTGGSFVIDLTPPAVATTDGTHSTGAVENAPGYVDGVTLRGTGEAGASISVTANGTTLTTTVAANGTWSVTFTGSQLPGGEVSYPVTIAASDVHGNVTTITDTIDIDTVAPPLTADVVATDDIVSRAEAAAPLTLSGTTVAGGSVTVVLAGVTRTVTAGSDGVWRATFPGGTLASGDYSVNATLTTQDAVGNTTTVTKTFHVDTVANVAFAATIAGDNAVNASEQAAGVNLTGTSDPGSTVSVTWNGVTRAATVAADGSWSAYFAASTISTGSYDSVATVSATDPRGNTATSTRTITVDTVASVAFDSVLVGDNAVSGAERAAGVTLTGTAEVGSTVAVSWNGTTLPATVAANGAWQVTFPAGQVPSGTQSTTALVIATDSHGNTATQARTIYVDTETSVAIGANQVGDNAISGAERAAGVTLTGTAEAGALVAVTLAGVTHTVTANAAGVWQSGFSAGELPTGTSRQTISVTSTDALGNTATATQSILIDTEVSNLARSTLSSGSDGVLNNAEAASGLTVTGMVEPGSAVTIQLGSGSSYAAVVAANGSWTATIPAATLPTGEANATLSIRATDAVGNTQTITETVVIDRVVTNFTHVEVIGGDGRLNAAETAAGLALTGTAEAGATVALQLASGAVVSTTANASGVWTANFTSAQLPHGEGSDTLRITATDRAGNVATMTETFAYDTVAPTAASIVGQFKTPVGLMGIYMDPTTDSHSYYSVNAAGTATRLTATETHDNTFNWDNATFSTPVADGNYLVVASQDGAGNSAATLYISDNSSTVSVDLTRSGLQNFDFSSIDLTAAPSARLTINETQLRAITGSDATLTIHGDAQDSITLQGVTATATHQLSGDGHYYDVYTLGSGAKVWLEEDVQRTVS